VLYRKYLHPASDNTIGVFNSESRNCLNSVASFKRELDVQITQHRWKNTYLSFVKIGMQKSPENYDDTPLIQWDFREELLSTEFMR
jgi:hypothetical protein